MDPDKQALQFELSIIPKLADDAFISDLTDNLEGAFADFSKTTHDVFGNAAKNADVLLTKVTRQTQQWNSQIKSVEFQIKRAKILGLSYNDQLVTLRKIQNEMRDTLNDQETCERLLESQTKDFLKIEKTIQSIRGEHESIVPLLKKWASHINDIGGVGGLGNFISNLTRVSGVVAIMTAQIKSYLDLQSKWTAQNYTAYGSISDIADSVIDVQRNFKLTAEQAEKAAEAVMDVGMTEGSMVDLAGAVGDLSAETKISEMTAARFARKMQSLGYTTVGITTQFLNLKKSMAAWKLTGQDSDAVLNSLGEVMGTIQERLGDDGMTKYADNLVKISALAKAAGSDLGMVAGVMNDLTKDPGRFAAVLGSAAYLEEDPSANFVKLLNVSDQVLSKLKEFPAGVREHVAREFGFASVESVKQIDLIRKQLQATGTDLATLSPDQVIKKFEEIRRAQDPILNLKIAIQDIGRALLVLLGPVIMVIGWIGKLANAYSGLGEWTKNIIAWTVMLGGALLLFGGKIGMLFKPISGLTSWFKSLFTAGKNVASLGDNLASFFRSMDQIKLSSIGKAALVGVILVPLGAAMAIFGLASMVPIGNLSNLGAEFAVFFGHLGSISWSDIVKAAAVMVVLAGSLWIMSKAIAGLSGSQMVAAGLGFIELAVGLKIMSSVGQSSMVGMLQGALGMAAMGVAMIAMAYAFSLATPAQMIAGSVAILILAGAAAVMGAVGVAALPGMLAIGAGMLLVSGSLLVAAYAFKVFVGALAEMQAVDFGAISASVLAASWNMAAAAAPLSLGMAGLAAAALAGVLALPSLMLVSVGLWNFGAALSGVSVSLVNAVKISAAFKILTVGINAIASSRYIAFALASGRIASGLNSILPALTSSGISALPAISGYFSTAMEKIKDGAFSIANSDSRFAQRAEGVAKGLAVLLPVLAANTNAMAALPGFSSSFASAMSSLKDGAFLVGESDSRFSEKASSASRAISEILGAVGQGQSQVGALKPFGEAFAAAMGSMKDGAYVLGMIDFDKVEADIKKLSNVPVQLQLISAEFSKVDLSKSTEIKGLVDGLSSLSALDTSTIDINALKNTCAELALVSKSLDAIEVIDVSDIMSMAHDLDDIAVTLSGIDLRDTSNLRLNTKDISEAVVAIRSLGKIEQPTAFISAAAIVGRGSTLLAQAAAVDGSRIQAVADSIKSLSDLPDLSGLDAKIKLVSDSLSQINTKSVDIDGFKDIASAIAGLTSVSGSADKFSVFAKELDGAIKDLSAAGSPETTAKLLTLSNDLRTFVNSISAIDVTALDKVSNAFKGLASLSTDLAGVKDLGTTLDTLSTLKVADASGTIDAIVAIADRAKSGDYTGLSQLADGTVQLQKIAINLSQTKTNDLPDIGKIEKAVQETVSLINAVKPVDGRWIESLAKISVDLKNAVISLSSLNDGVITDAIKALEDPRLSKLSGMLAEVGEGLGDIQIPNFGELAKAVDSIKTVLGQYAELGALAGQVDVGSLENLGKLGDSWWANGPISRFLSVLSNNKDALGLIDQFGGLSRAIMSAKTAGEMAAGLNPSSFDNLSKIGDAWYGNGPISKFLGALSDNAEGIKSLAAFAHLRDAISALADVEKSAKDIRPESFTSLGAIGDNWTSGDISKFLKILTNNKDAIGSLAGLTKIQDAIKALKEASRELDSFSAENFKKLGALYESGSLWSFLATLQKNQGAVTSLEPLKNIQAAVDALFNASWKLGQGFDPSQFKKLSDAADYMEDFIELIQKNQTAVDYLKKLEAIDEVATAMVNASNTIGTSSLEGIKALGNVAEPLGKLGAAAQNSSNLMGLVAIKEVAIALEDAQLHLASLEPKHFNNLLVIAPALSSFLNAIHGDLSSLVQMKDFPLAIQGLADSMKHLSALDPVNFAKLTQISSPVHDFLEAVAGFDRNIVELTKSLGDGIYGIARGGEILKTLSANDYRKLVDVAQVLVQLDPMLSNLPTDEINAMGVIGQVAVSLADAQKTLGGIDPVLFENLVGISRSITNAINELTAIEEDSVVRLSSILDIFDGIESFKNAVGTVDKSADDFISASVRLRDAQKTLVASSDPSVFSSLAKSTQTVVDALNILTRIDDSGIQRLQSAADSLGSLSSLDVSGFGQLTSVSDAFTGLFQDLSIFKDATGADAMLALADSMQTALDSISKTIETYAVYIESVADRISSVVGEVAAQTSKIPGGDLKQSVNSNIIVNSTTDIDQSAISARHSEMMGVLTSIRDAIGQLVEGTKDESTKNQLTEINETLGRYLPQMAEDNSSGLAKPMARWNSGH